MLRGKGPREEVLTVRGGPEAVVAADRSHLSHTTSEVIRAIWCAGSHIAPQSEVIRVIVLEYSQCCGVPHRPGLAVAVLLVDHLRQSEAIRAI